MKRILSLALVAMMMVSVLPVAYAAGCFDGQEHNLAAPVIEYITETDYHSVVYCTVCRAEISRTIYDFKDDTVWGSNNGTLVNYNAADDTTIGDSNNDGSPDNKEYYTVTVPALLAPGQSGDVKAEGTWASNRELVVTADTKVTLTNSINAADKKDLNVTFTGITLGGSNTAPVSQTLAVSVSEMPADALFGTWSGTFMYNVVIQDVK